MRPDLSSSIEAAYTFGYPLFVFAQTQYQSTEDPENPERFERNTIRHNRQLSDHRSVWITAPNNDTLYSNAWLDLSQGPVRVTSQTMPDVRYWSIALMDAFTNHFSVLGQRENGVGPVDVWLVSHGHQGQMPEGTIITTPGDDVWMFCRCLVDGPHDLPQTHAMQDRIKVSGPQSPAYRPTIVPENALDPENFLEVVNAFLLRNPVSADENTLIASWFDIGVRPGERGVWQTLGVDVQQVWTSAAKRVFANLRQAGNESRRDFDGWIAGAAETGRFGANYPLRASVALGGLGALIKEEAMYFMRYSDSAGQPLDGSQSYRLRVPRKGIPARSFWSFTMYASTPDGRRVLVENPISRYSIGNRTAGLGWNDDGSLDIALQRHEPTSSVDRANWLPTPDGPFHIALRAYVPSPELTEGRAPLPDIMRLSA